ncbi:MAG TPA: C39 family peptidase [Gordonibacter urolithinfaciens]|uniref:C39 family peptidase n=1 Tax=Gordonibacter urolithinfaciens TaxID=1335613 RepID=UPI001D46B8CA|nr:C39 family peptidase [Gordonibacter urolithinfaciens]HJF63787.1 C39 family peptidase [Gordonibacter urolithinfaciens]
MTYTNSYRAAHRRPAGRAARASATAPMPPIGRNGAPAYSRTSYRASAPSAARRRRSLAVRAALAVVLVAALAGAGWYAVGTLSALAHGGAAAGAGTPDAPQSTPRSAWRAGEVPALYQRDPAWSQALYGGDAFGVTGCGPTCLAMAYVALTGRSDLSPADAGALSERMGCASSDGTAWDFMTEGAAQLGLTAEELPADKPSVRRALVAGRPVICSMGPGDFTSTGHFIVLAGIDEHGRLEIRDPNSPERTAQTWDFDTVLRQCRNLWAYSAA